MAAFTGMLTSMGIYMRGSSMSLTRSASAASITAALFLSTALVLGGCSSKDEGPSAAKSSSSKALGLSGPSEKAFAKHFAVPNRKVSDAEAQQALALLKLGKPSGEGLSWDETSGADGNYSYSGLTIKDESSSLNIKSANLIGVHMVGDEASFDRADFSGITMIDTEDNGTVTFESVSIARPSPAMARSIIEGLGNIKGVDDLDLNIDDDEDVSFGAIGMSGMDIKSDDMNLTAKTMLWGTDEENGLADFKVEDIRFNGTDKNGGSFTGKLGNVSVMGLKTEAYSSVTKGMRGSMKSPMGAMGSFNPLAKVYDTVVMDDFSFDSDSVSVSAKGIEGKATEKGGVTTIRQVSEPIIIKLKDNAKDLRAKRAFDMLKPLEFDELVFQTSGTSILDANKDTVELKDGLFTMKDGFKLSYNYGATGVKAMSDKMAAVDNNASGQDITASMDALKLSGFQLRLEDDSIIDRSLNLAAQMRGGTPESIRQELKVGLALAPMMAGGGLEGDMMAEMANAFGEFIENGGTLSIVMDPKTPIAINDLAKSKNSSLTFKDLGFSAKAE